MTAGNFDRSFPPAVCTEVIFAPVACCGQIAIITTAAVSEQGAPAPLI